MLNVKLNDLVSISPQATQTGSGHLAEHQDRRAPRYAEVTRLQMSAAVCCCPPRLLRPRSIRTDQESPATVARRLPSDRPSDYLIPRAGRYFGQH
jgi:hypothetical protein